MARYAPVDNWSSRRPFTAEYRVQFPAGVPLLRNVNYKLYLYITINNLCLYKYKIKTNRTLYKI